MMPGSSTASFFESCRYRHSGPATIDGLEGNDTIDASSIPAGQVALTLIGSCPGNDVLRGNTNAETFHLTLGEGGHDVIQALEAHGGSKHGSLMALAGFADHGLDAAVASSQVVQFGADVAVSGGGSIVTTLNVSLGSVHSQDFWFI